jgi:hypothetical protein
MLNQSSSKSALVRPLPAGFARHFDAAGLSARDSTVIAIDPRGRIVWLNPGWYEFASRNGGQQVIERFGLGACYLDGISGSLRDLFERALRRSLATREPFEHSYECSSASLHRLHRLRVLPVVGAGFLLEHSQICELPSSEVPALALPARYVDEHGLVAQCSNCRKVRRADRSAWDWVPEWVAQSPSGTTHGICEVCVGFYWGLGAR